MEITEVRVKLMDRERHGSLRAFISVTFDNTFVVRDIKVIEVNNRLQIAMPSRTLSVRCPVCDGKNYWSKYESYCITCGELLPDELFHLGDRQSPFIDVCHPINSQARRWIEAVVLTAYRQEVNAGQSSCLQEVERGKILLSQV